MLQFGSKNSLFESFFPESPGTNFIDMEGRKAQSTLEPRIAFQHGIPGLGIQRLNH